MHRDCIGSVDDNDHIYDPECMVRYVSLQVDTNGETPQHYTRSPKKIPERNSI
jgi:hypothetical protein